MNLQSDVKILLDTLGEKAFTQFEKMPIIKSRSIIENGALYFPKHPKMLETRDYTTQYNFLQFTCRLYIPLKNTSPNLIIFIHGGGWVFSSINTHDHLARSIADSTSFFVLSLNYPLAPEYKYPIALDYLYNLVSDIYYRKLVLDIEFEKLFVCGDSSGGNLAAALCLMFSDNNVNIIEGQILLLPITSRSMKSKSYKENEKAPMLNKSIMNWFWNQYIDTNDDFYANILNHPLNKRIPPALIITAQYDPLRDEGRLYANKLKNRNIPVRHKTYKGVFHGFVRQSHLLKAGKDVLVEISKFLNNLV